MTEDEKQRALQDIAYIKEMVSQAREDISHFGSGWIVMLWGLFTYVGVAGQMFLFTEGLSIGLWWTGLTIVTIILSFMIARSQIRGEPPKKLRTYARWFMIFWLPLLALAYTLALFCVFLPGLSHDYITIFILLVISTGYIMLGLMFFRGIFLMGLIGMVGTIITAIFFLEYTEIILGVLFGTGLLISGLVVNFRWKNLNGRTSQP
jgi:hypothetical protein